MQIINLSPEDTHLATNPDIGTQRIYTQDDKGNPYIIMWNTRDYEMKENDG